MTSLDATAFMILTTICTIFPSSILDFLHSQTRIFGLLWLFAYSFHKAK